MRPATHVPSTLRQAVERVYQSWETWIARWGSKRPEATSMMQSCLDELRNQVNRVAHSTLAWLITDQTGAQFGPYSAAQLGSDGGALRLELKGHKPQCIP